MPSASIGIITSSVKEARNITFRGASSFPDEINQAEKLTIDTYIRITCVVVNCKYYVRTSVQGRR